MRETGTNAAAHSICDRYNQSLLVRILELEADLALEKDRADDWNESADDLTEQLDKARADLARAVAERDRLRDAGFCVLALYADWLHNRVLALSVSEVVEPLRAALAGADAPGADGGAGEGES